MAFDTLKFSRQLSAAGMQGAQADMLAEALGEMLNESAGERAVSRAEFEIVLDHLALLREQISLMRDQAGPAGLGGPQDQPGSENLISRRPLLHLLAVLVGALAANTTLLAWLFDLL